MKLLHRHIHSLGWIVISALLLVQPLIWAHPCHTDLADASHASAPDVEEDCALCDVTLAAGELMPALVWLTPVPVGGFAPVSGCPVSPVVIRGIPSLRAPPFA
ncbi:MAG: hypothetical protein SF053_11100 [Bacteroidia bacterium]|nr:hypothetical protein [Bacteroidia bacterium]